MAKNFPTIVMKLINNNDFPLYFCGICSESKVLAIMRLIPKPIPPRISVNKNVMNRPEYTMARLPRT